MRRVFLLVEGQTEEHFARQLLESHLAQRRIALTTILLTSRRSRGGEKVGGGMTSFGKFERDIRQLGRDTGVAAITTLLDLFRLPRDFPGMADPPPASHPSGAARARRIGLPHIRQACPHFDAWLTRLEALAP